MQSDNPHALKRCGAKTRSGEPCRSKAMPNGRCRMHGGTSTGRPIIHGRHSKYLPKRLKEVYEERLRDSEILSLQPDVALIEAILAESLALMDGPSSAEWWKAAKETFDDLQKAIKTQDGVKLLDAVTRLDSILENGLGMQQKEQKVLGLIEQKRRVSESEVKRLVAGQAAIPVRELMVILAMIIDLVNKYVPDPATKRQLGAAIARVIPAQVSN